MLNIKTLIYRYIDVITCVCKKYTYIYCLSRLSFLTIRIAYTYKQGVASKLRIF